jgi:hypothetical protein
MSTGKIFLLEKDTAGIKALYFSGRVIYNDANFLSDDRVILSRHQIGISLKIG